MINFIKITKPTGEYIVIDLRSPEKSGFFVRNIDGLGSPKSQINLSESLYNDGSYYNSSRVSQRNIVLDLGFMDTPTESIEAIRNKTYRFFPMKTPLSIYIGTDTKKGVTTGYVESNEANIFSKEEGTIISLVCPDAYFSGANYIQTTFTGTTASFEFPFENLSLTLPLIEFGNVFVNTQSNVFYAGEVPTGILLDISFKGAVNNLTIHNVSTGSNFAINSTKLIALTGSDFINGDKVYISTVKGDKYIYLFRSGIWINILNTVDFLSDWFQINSGDNVFTYTAVSGLSNIVFSILHRDLYEGL